jgi:hypothetical protein
MMDTTQGDGKTEAEETGGETASSLDLSIFRAGLNIFLLFRVEKILPTTIPLDTSGLNFRVGLESGPGLGGPPAYFIA